MKKNIGNSDKTLTETILRYSFNGRSKYLIDKFYIMGFDSKTLHKNLINNDNSDDDILNKSDRISTNVSFEDKFHKSESKKNPQIFHIEDPPTILNEFTSDYKKQIPDKDLIKEMIFPNKIDFYYCEEPTKLLSDEYCISRTRPFSINTRQSNYTLNFNNNEYINNEFENLFIEDEYINYNNNNIKSYNVIFSYNPQTGINSKKSINGFAHVFYRKFFKNRIYGEKLISFFVPVIFCIISEYPFYNSFYLLCNQIKNLYNEKKLEVPLEIIIYNIINFTLSPLNNDVFFIY